MSDELLVTAAIYAVIFGAICYALAERKGMAGGEAFTYGFILGIFGLLIVLLKPDGVRQAPTVQPARQVREPEPQAGFLGLLVVAVTVGLIAAVFAYVVLK